MLAPDATKVLLTVQSTVFRSKSIHAFSKLRISVAKCCEHIRIWDFSFNRFANTIQIGDLSCKIQQIALELKGLKLVHRNLVGNLFFRTLLGNPASKSCFGTCSWEFCLGSWAFFGNLAWEPCLGSSSWRLDLRNLSFGILGTCSWEPILKSQFFGNLAWEHVLRNLAWEPCLGTLLGNLASELAPCLETLLSTFA